MQNQPTTTHSSESWHASRNEEYFEGEYLDREHAIAAYPEEYGLEPGDQFWTGRSVPFHPASINLADPMIEHLRDRAYDECGEYAENYLDDVTQEMEDDLQQMLVPVVEAWLEKHKLQARFFTVTDVQEHIVPEDGDAD